MFTDLFRFWGLAKPTSGTEKKETQDWVTKAVKEPEKKGAVKKVKGKASVKTAIFPKDGKLLKEGKELPVSISAEKKQKAEKKSDAVVTVTTARLAKIALAKTKTQDDKQTSMPLKNLDSIKKKKKSSTQVVSTAVPLVQQAEKTREAKRISPVIAHKTAQNVVETVSATPLPVPQPKAKKTVRSGTLVAPSMENVPVIASMAAKATFQQASSHSSYQGAGTVLNLAKSIKKDAKRVQNWKKLPLEDLMEADIEAMPDEEYMNDTQLAFFRLHLLRLKQGILENADHTSEHLREDSLVVPDPTDRATIEEEHALELRTRDRERKLLKKIDQAISRIDHHDYGYCDETGEPIGIGRLLARPTATLSLEAQQRREMKQRLFGEEAN
jgi:DnaK suppressor protein